MNTPINIKVRRNSKQEQILRDHCSDFVSFNGNIATIDNIYSESKRVLDVARHTIIARNGVIHLQDSSIQNIDIQESSNRKFVLIIESPHKDEYNENFTPLHPAQGQTGDRIRDFFCHIFNQQSHAIPDGSYDLIISNPVQFQASLYNLHHKTLNAENGTTILRNKVWTAIYRYEKENFINRIRSYTPILVVIATTAKLKTIINQDIVRTFPDLYRLRADSHPCIWGSSSCFRT